MPVCERNCEFSHDFVDLSMTGNMHVKDKLFNNIVLKFICIYTYYKEETFESFFFVCFNSKTTGPIVIILSTLEGYVAIYKLQLKH